MPGSSLSVCCLTVWLLISYHPMALAPALLALLGLLQLHAAPSRASAEDGTCILKHDGLCTITGHYLTDDCPAAHPHAISCSGYQRGPGGEAAGIGTYPYSTAPCTCVAGTSYKGYCFKTCAGADMATMTMVGVKLPPHSDPVNATCPKNTRVVGCGLGANYYMGAAYPVGDDNRTCQCYRDHVIVPQGDTQCFAMCYPDKGLASYSVASTRASSAARLTAHCPAGRAVLGCGTEFGLWPSYFPVNGTACTCASDAGQPDTSGSCYAFCGRLTKLPPP